MTAAPPAALSWQTARRVLLLERSLIVGIINVTPDSFSDGGRHLKVADAVAAARRMQAEGADILDVGGESTRPGATPPGESEELRRVIPVIEKIVLETGLPVSVDTRSAAVARAALAAGAEIVNDVSALAADPLMAEVVAEAGAGAVLVHMKGEPATMDRLAVYDDVVGEVARALLRLAAIARDAGVHRDSIVLDPGLGFAKDTAHNLALLRGLPHLVKQGFPVLVGPSRKRFLGAVTGKTLGERDAATAAACVAARMGGAALFRVHDVASARTALDVADAILAAGGEQA
jgi:dihydropteroate synthase